MLQLDLIALATLILLGLAGLAALAVLLADAERLPRLVHAGLESVFGQERLAELLALQAAWERRVLSGTQLAALRVLGALLGGLLALALLFARQPAGLALVLGGGAALLAAAYPGVAFRRGLLRREIVQAEEHVVGFIVHLRQEITLGVPIEQAIRGYVDGQRNALADLLAGMPAGTGTDPIAGVCEMAVRSGSLILLPVASSLRSLRRARDPRSVLRNMEERARLMLVARLNEENARRRLAVLMLTVSLMLLAMLALIIVPILLRLATIGQPA
jgi:hypothetical protein